VLLPPRSPLLYSSVFNPPPTPETSPLSLHDALPILTVSFIPFAPGSAMIERAPSARGPHSKRPRNQPPTLPAASSSATRVQNLRSEEHTSELQSLTNLVCRLLLEKKNAPDSSYAEPR